MKVQKTGKRTLREICRRVINPFAKAAVLISTLAILNCGNARNMPKPDSGPLDGIKGDSKPAMCIPSSSKVLPCGKKSSHKLKTGDIIDTGPVKIRFQGLVKGPMNQTFAKFPIMDQCGRFMFDANISELVIPAGMPLEGFPKSVIRPSDKTYPSHGLSMVLMKLDKDNQYAVLEIATAKCEYLTKEKKYCLLTYGLPRKEGEKTNPVLFDGYEVVSDASGNLSVININSGKAVKPLGKPKDAVLFLKYKLQLECPTCSRIVVSYECLTN